MGGGGYLHKANANVSSLANHSAQNLPEAMVGQSTRKHIKNY